MWAFRNQQAGRQACTPSSPPRRATSEKRQFMVDTCITGAGPRRNAAAQWQRNLSYHHPCAHTAGGGASSSSSARGDRLSARCSSRAATGQAAASETGVCACVVLSRRVLTPHGTWRGPQGCTKSAVVLRAGTRRGSRGGWVGGGRQRHSGGGAGRSANGLTGTLRMLFSWTLKELGLGIVSSSRRANRCTQCLCRPSPRVTRRVVGGPPPSAARTASAP